MSKTVTLPVLPLDDEVVLPAMVVPLSLSEDEVRAAIDSAGSPGLGGSGDKPRVLVVPRLDAARVAKAGEEREKKETVNRARLEKGELGLDIYGMRKSLAEKGLEYIDGPLD